LIDKIQQQPQQRLQTKVSILIVDSKVCLIEDLKVYDDNSSDEGLPLATYSNSESTVLTYISIFETLWTQTELNKQSVI
jgi:two-component system, OmpR family, sensor histidine kinase VicK